MPNFEAILNSVINN